MKRTEQSPVRSICEDPACGNCKTKKKIDLVEWVGGERGKKISSWKRERGISVD